MSALVRIQVRKELRELLPWWAGTIVTILACASLSRFVPLGLGGSQFLPVGLLVYGAGAVALGALSIGHEYTHRTLAPLLAQPIDRWRLLITKFAVLLPMVIALAAVLWMALSWADAANFPWHPMMLLPILAAVFVAPWLTMVTRGPLAGTVFAIAIPALLLGIGRAAWSGMGGWTLMWQGTTVLAAIGALMTVRTFLTLEAIDGPQAEIGLPAWLGRQTIPDHATTRTRSRIWLVIGKEIRLQQMTLIVSGFYLAAWLGIVVARHLVFGFGGPDLSTIAILHGGLVAVMAGALASAEERQFGTADWQILLPTAAWQQWAIKAGVAIALAVGLGIGLPALLALADPSTEAMGFKSQYLHFVILLCAASLYVSSLSTSGMRAFLASFPALAGVLVVWVAIRRPIGAIVTSGLRPVAQAVSPLVATSAYPRLLESMLLVLVAGLAVLLLRLAYENHRSAERGTARIRRHLGWIAAYIAGGTAVLAFVSTMFGAAIGRR